ncbi:MAG: cell division protein SepF [Cenarchaeum symbiont of Oopsacas minuta]|nr:cell division protein SepF [Cenarchaeum symbiont of Oopsacas minuta]
MFYWCGDQKFPMQKQESSTYLKAFTIRDPSDIESIRKDIKKGMVLILRVTPLAQKDVEKLRTIVEDIYKVAKTNDADIARLGEERIIVTPSNVKIWKAEYDLK